MIELADHWNLWTEIPKHVVLAAGLTVLFVPTSFIGLLLGLLVPRPFGIVLGMAVALVPALWLVYGFTCWGCPDHETVRQIVFPGSIALGAIPAAYAVARLPSFLEQRK